MRAIFRSVRVEWSRLGSTCQFFLIKERRQQTCLSLARLSYGMPRSAGHYGTARLRSHPLPPYLPMKCRFSTFHLPPVPTFISQLHQHFFFFSFPKFPYIVRYKQIRKSQIWISDFGFYILFNFQQNSDENMRIVLRNKRKKKFKSYSINVAKDYGISQAL